jgi:hypothetical protein
MSKEIRAVMIVEVAGKPAEYVRESTEVHISRLDQMQDIEVISKKFSDPKRIEGPEEAYTCFSEIEFETPTFQRLLDLIFDFMPSSIEILSPSVLEFDCQEATMFINNLAGRLHRYDEIAKIAQFRVKHLSEELTLLKNATKTNEKRDESRKTKNKKKS